MRGRDRPGRAWGGAWLPCLGVGLGAAACGWFVLLAGGADARGGLPLDDAWIHQVYGRAVAAGGMLAFNDGVPSTGATSPLWAYLLGGIHLLASGSGAVLAWTRGLGLLLHALAAALVARIVLRASGSRAVAGVAGLLLGACPPLAVAAVSGMEVPLACALLAAALDRHLADRAWTTGLFLGLAGLARPELGLAGALFVADAGVRAARGKGRAGDVLRMLLPMVLLGGAFVEWNLWATGRPLTATFYRKVNAGEILPLLDRLATGAGMLLAEPPLLPAAFVLALAAGVVARRRLPRGTGLALAAGGAHAAASVAMVAPLDAESFYFLRYLLPAVPLLWVGAVLPVAVWVAGAPPGASDASPVPPGARQDGEATGLAGKPRVPSRRRMPPWVPVVLAGALAAFTGAMAAAGLPGWALRHAAWCRNISDVQVRLGRLLDRSLPPDGVVASTDAGAVRYFGRRHTVDLMGLNTPRPGDGGDPGPRVDAAVFMPAWMAVQRSPRLELLAQAKADGYAISTNPAFALQVAMACRTGDGEAEGDLDLPAAILGAELTLPMRCHDAATLARWKGEAP